MAGIKFVAGVRNLDTGTAEPQTVIQITAASNHRVLIRAASISFRGTNTTEEPISVTLMHTDGDGTPISPETSYINKMDQDAAETLQTTVESGHTAEPGGKVPLNTWDIHWQTGVIYPMPIPDDLPVRGGKGFAIVIENVTTDVKCSAWIEGEE